MKFGLRTLKRLLGQALAERPPRSPEEEDRLLNPRTPEARAVLAFAPAVTTLPVEAVFEDVLPYGRVLLEELALDCEQDGPDGEAARERVRAWVTTAKSVLGSVDL